MATTKAIDLKRLQEMAFFAEDVENATEAIERARVEFAELTKAGAQSFELVAPADPDERWVRDHLLRPLVYFCESEGRPVPRCPGIFVSLFVGNRLSCITVPDVIEWAHEQLGLTAEQLRDEYGTHEHDTALR